MYAFLVHDDRGAAATDWVAMTAGVIVLGLVVAYSVLGDSHVYLVETFEDLNAELEQNNQSVAQLEETSDARK